jgi:hypothetical protein
LADFLKNYEVKTVGGSEHKEYWIPADDLDEFNRNIVGNIEVVAEYRANETGASVNHERRRIE